MFVFDLADAPPLTQAFYQRDPARVAQELLGKILLRKTRAGFAGGRIVETEAYRAEGDSASHAFRGPSRRNRAMFGPPGRAYVYAIHAKYCFNAVTEYRGQASAVLIRSMEPLVGLTQMQTRRKRERLLDLARGPARICQALEIDRRLDSWNLTRGKRLWIVNPHAPLTTSDRILQTPRIGVTSAKELLLRFCLADCPFVSGPRKWRT